MGRYFLGRLGYAVLTIFLIATVTFFMMHAIPGGPFSREKPLPPALLRVVEEKYNLNAPVYEQYLDYLQGLLRLDFGPSFQKVGTSVNDLLIAGFPATIQVGLLAVILIVVAGVPLGIISALKQNTALDWTVMLGATLGVTIPSFVFATVYIFIFAGILGWVPSFGIKNPLGLIGPVVALSVYSLAFVSRLTRSSMLEVLRADYIQTARANGISEWKVIGKHAVKNALIPVITYMGPTIAAILTGSFVVERIFAIPGVGRYFVESVSNRDYTTIMAVTVVYASIYVILVLLVDVLYALVDPRIRFTKEKA